MKSPGRVNPDWRIHGPVCRLWRLPFYFVLLCGNATQFPMGRERKKRKRPGPWKLIPPVMAVSVGYANFPRETDQP